MLELLSYTPILKGLIILVIAGVTFPLAGISLLRLNLLPMRFMLMHGAILGGAIALASSLNPVITTLIVNVCIVLLLSWISASHRVDAGQVSAFLMVLAISLAFIIIYRFDVPSKDTFTLLWGSIYTISWFELLGMAGFSLFLLLFTIYGNKQIVALFFDREVAHSSGVNEKRLYYIIVLIIAATLAIAMKLLGALLVDALFLLPALIATSHSKSMKGTFIAASVWGTLLSVSGFFVALWLDIPVSSSIAALAAILFLSFLISKRV